MKNSNKFAFKKDFRNSPDETPVYITTDQIDTMCKNIRIIVKKQFPFKRVQVFMTEQKEGPAIHLEVQSFPNHIGLPVAVLLNYQIQGREPADILIHILKDINSKKS